MVRLDNTFASWYWTRSSISFTTVASSFVFFSFSSWAIFSAYERTIASAQRVVGRGFVSKLSGIGVRLHCRARLSSFASDGTNKTNEENYYSHARVRVPNHYSEYQPWRIEQILLLEHLPVQACRDIPARWWSPWWWQWRVMKMIPKTKGKRHPLTVTHV